MTIRQVINGLTAFNDLQDEIAQDDGSLVGRAGRAVCDAYASNPGAVENVAGAGAIQGKASGAAIRETCRPYYEQQQIPEPGRADGSLPFEGGQCPGDRYEVDPVGVRLDTGVGVSYGGQVVVGPILSIAFAAPSSTSDISLIVTHGVPAVTRIVSSSTNTSPSNVEITDFNIANLDNPGDTCGNPSTPPYGPQPGNPGTPFGSPQTKPVGGEPFTFTPRVEVSPDGTISIPVSIDGGDDEIVINPTGPGGDDGATGVPPGTVDGSSESLPAGGGAVDDPNNGGADEDGYRVIGYRWRLIGEPPGIGKIAGANPAIYPRVVGNITLEHPGEFGFGWSGTPMRIEAERGLSVVDNPYLRVRGARVNIDPSFGGVSLTPVKAREIVAPEE